MGEWYQYNPDKAKALLKEAGVGPGFSTAIILYEYAAHNRDISEMIADMLKQVGVEVKVQSMDYSSFSSQWVGKKYEDMANGWGTISFDADVFAYNQMHSKSLGNRSFINDPVIDDLAVKQRAEPDPAKRKAILKQIWDQELNQVYRINLPNPFSFDLQQPYVRGMRWGTWVSSYYQWGLQTENVWLEK